MIRVFWAILGILALILGIIGAIFPVLPAIPFFILAAGAFAKSSRRIYILMITHKHLGPIIKHWRRNRTLPTKVKMMAIIMTSISIVSLSLLLLVYFTKG